MAESKKNVKYVKIKRNVYLPHKIRSHPFYFIFLPLKAVIFYIFYWIVLVPVLYSVLLNNVAPFPGRSLCYFLGMLVVFLLIMSIFICDWRCKKKRKTDIYYIQSQVPEPQEMVEMKQHQVPEPQEMVEMKVHIPLSDLQSKPKIEYKDIPEEISVTPRKRPSPLSMEHKGRPYSQNLNSPLTPRELFFLDLYENANATMLSDTNNFIEMEKRYYESGPVEHCSSDNKHVEECPVPQMIHPIHATSEFLRIERIFYGSGPVNHPVKHPIRETPTDECVPLHSGPIQKHFTKKASNKDEYFIANVVSSTCTTEAYLFVEEPKVQRQPFTIVVDMEGNQVYEKDN